MKRNRAFLYSTWACSPALALVAASCNQVKIEGSSGLYYLQNDHRASRTDTLDLQLKTGETLKADLRSGVVRIKSAGGSVKPEVKARITAFGSNPEEAAANLDKCKIQTGRADSGAAIRFEGEDYEYREKFTVIKLRPQLELDITVPDGVALDIDTGNGSINAVGPFAACELSSRYGAVELTYADGDVRAQSSSGSIKIAKISGAHTVRAKSGYGNVTVSDVTAGEITAESSSGSVEIQDTKADSIHSDSRYGKLVFSRVSGAIRGKTSSGSVELTEADKGDISLESGYGSIKVQKASGSLIAKTSSGSVQIGQYKGSVDARSSYGSVTITGTITKIAAESGSGSIKIVALPGSECQESWSAHSGYGNVDLALPEDFYCNLSSQTSYGRIHCDFPVLVPGDSGEKKKNELHGLLNSQIASGAPAPRELKLSTSSGNIYIRKQN